MAAPSIVLGNGLEVDRHLAVAHHMNIQAAAEENIEAVLELIEILHSSAEVFPSKSSQDLWIKWGLIKPDGIMVNSVARVLLNSEVQRGLDGGIKVNIHTKKKVD